MSQVSPKKKNSKTIKQLKKWSTAEDLATDYLDYCKNVILI